VQSQFLALVWLEKPAKRVGSVNMVSVVATEKPALATTESFVTIFKQVDA
jgi:hypothetical protein